MLLSRGGAEPGAGSPGWFNSEQRPESVVQAALERADLEQGRSSMAYLPYRVEEVPEWRHVMGSYLADAGTQGGTTHTAELSRRERKRIYSYMSSAVRGDMTLTSIWAPLWRHRPVGLLPSAGNPAAMWHAFPEYELEFAELSSKKGLPTHGAPTAQLWEHWRLGHFWHCDRCQAYSLWKLGRPPPMERLLGAMADGWRDPGGWVTDPDCYVQLMVHHVRTGFEPRVDSSVRIERVRIPNLKVVYQEWEGMLRYLESLERVQHDVLTPPSFSPPEESSSLLPVVRPRARRLFEEEGVAYKVRPCLNLKPQGNGRFYKWPCRLCGVDCAVRLVTDDEGYDHVLDDDGLLWIVILDLTKYYLYLGLGAVASRICSFSDPRYEVTWPLKSEPPESWKRIKEQGRRGRWRRFSCCPFGLAPMVAYCSALSGEMSMMLLALGLPNNYYIDDDFILQRGRKRSVAAKQLAQQLGRWLGFSFSAKSVGPVRVGQYLGLIVDLEKRELRCTPAHRQELTRKLSELREAGSIRVKELKRLCGTMTWMASVMRGGDTFTRNLYALLRGRENDDVAALDGPARQHVAWWLERLADPAWKGSAIILAKHQHPVTTFKSVASGDGRKMWGYVYQGRLHWCQPEEKELTTTHIQYREMLPVLHCAEEYGAGWKNRVVRVGVDNVADAYAINKRRSPDDGMQHLLEMLAERSRKMNFLLVASHVDRRFNWLADMTTRFVSFDQFVQVLPERVELDEVPSITTCRARCPGTRSPVFCVQLKISAPGQ